MSAPLVSVICLCYNHEQFLEEAIVSVINQTYQNIQIIVVDDASQDGSAKKIQQVIKEKPDIEFLPLSRNHGNCKAFNIGLAKVKGDYVIDFATDDVMLPDRIEKQVRQFQSLDEDYGVVFSDAQYISSDGRFIRNHFEYLFQKNLITTIPQGDVYRDVLSTYFIPSPSMMTRKSVFDYLEGYDERLSYEDFDFWVRSARKFKYAYLDEITTKIRLSARSMSTTWYKVGDKQLHSTYLVCEKAVKLNQSPADELALAKRLKYEIRQSVFSKNVVEAKLFYNLLQKIGYHDTTSRLLIFLNEMNLPLAWLRNLYHRLRFKK